MQALPRTSASARYLTSSRYILSDIRPFEAEAGAVEAEAGPKLAFARRLTNGI